MSLPHIILWGIVLVVGVPSAWRNPTAGALVLCWVVSEGIYALTGNGLAVEYYAYPDIFTIAVIMMKPEACNLRPYRGAWHQLACMVLERSVADRIVMLIFPVMWAIYVSELHPYYQWWSLWGLSVIQFLAVGLESLLKSHRRHAEAADSLPDHQGDLLVAYVVGGRFG